MYVSFYSVWQQYIIWLVTVATYFKFSILFQTLQQVIKYVSESNII